MHFRHTVYNNLSLVYTQKQFLFGCFRSSCLIQSYLWELYWNMNIYFWIRTNTIQKSWPHFKNTFLGFCKPNYFPKERGNYSNLIRSWPIPKSQKLFLILFFLWKEGLILWGKMERGKMQGAFRSLVMEWIPCLILLSPTILILISCMRNLWHLENPFFLWFPECRF